MSEFPAELLADLIDDLDVAVFFTDGDGTVVHLNETASFIVRLPILTAVGRPLWRLLPQTVADFLMADGAEALATGRNRSRSTRSFIIPGRGLRYYDIRTIPYRRPAGGPWIAYLLLDITARERRTMATEQARENAEAEALARRAFLARMSHEIRTPMNGIMGMTDLAILSESREETAEYLGVIKSAADSLLAIINDVLDYAKVESGRMELEQIPFSPEALLEETLALLRPTAEAKGLILSGSAAPDVPKTLVGDPLRLKQIVTNLAANAVKFTEKGSVVVTFGKAPAFPDAEEDEFCLGGMVQDTGIGVDRDKLENLFEPFAQSGPAISRKYGGTGLGLAICRTLTRLMGGDVDAESHPGRGSVFRFRVRLKEIASPEAQKGECTATSGGQQKFLADYYRWDGCKVLLAEDNRVNRMVTEGLLGRVGLVPVSVENGRAAVEMWETENPDIILMDLQMPEMDGTDAARRIRELEAERRNGRIPIIALTAHIMDEERASAEDAGMDGWVTKPIKPSDLFAEVARLLPPVVSP